MVIDKKSCLFSHTHTHTQTYIISRSVCKWGGENLPQKGFPVAMPTEEETHFGFGAVDHHRHLKKESRVVRAE